MAARFPEGTTVGTIGEHAIVAAIRGRVTAPPAWLTVGIGDDGAVIEPARGHLEVLTTDGLVEGVHFDRRFSTPYDIGWKALAVNISDVASMGAFSRTALLSLALPAEMPGVDLDALLDGFFALAAEARIALAGGNITRSPGPLMVDVTVAGAVRKRDVLRRDGARPGDAIYVTGSIGSGLAGLQRLRSVAARGGDLPGHAETGTLACVQRYRRPDPRYRIGALLGRSRAATACMDLSDGLADAVTQIARASHVGARIDASALPIDAAVREWFESQGADPVVMAASGGDDYELLFTLSRKQRGRLRHVTQQARGVPITRIGEITADSAIVLTSDGREEPLPSGFVHF